MWAVRENFASGGAQRRLRRIWPGHRPRHGLRCTCFAHALGWRGAGLSQQPHPARLAAGQIKPKPPALLERPYRFSRPVGARRGLGAGPGWPTANLQVDGRKFLPAEGVLRRLGAPGLAAAACPDVMAAVMNLGRQPTVDPLAFSAWRCTCWDRERWIFSKPGSLEGGARWPCATSNSVRQSSRSSCPDQVPTPSKPASCSGLKRPGNFQPAGNAW